MKDVKSAIRTGYEKAKKNQVEKCYIFISNEYPEFEKKCIIMLSKYEFDD